MPFIIVGRARVAIVCARGPCARTTFGSMRHAPPHQGRAPPTLLASCALPTLINAQRKRKPLVFPLKSEKPDVKT